MKKRNRSAIFFMLPALLVYCCVVVLPALYTAFLSLFKWNGLGEKKVCSIPELCKFVYNRRCFQNGAEE